MNDITERAKKHFASADSLQVAKEAIRANGLLDQGHAAARQERALLVKYALTELRRRIALLDERGLSDRPYEDMAVGALREAGIEL